MRKKCELEPKSFTKDYCTTNITWSDIFMDKEYAFAISDKERYVHAWSVLSEICVGRDIRKAFFDEGGLDSFLLVDLDQQVTYFFYSSIFAMPGNILFLMIGGP